MKFKNILTSAILVFTLFTVKTSFSQCDTIATICGKHLSDGFISDGQEYRSLLLNDEIAEFHVTFYGGSTYRISACSGLSDGNLIFSVYDQERNLLFTNTKHKNAPYWDFNIKNTINCIIEAQLDPNNLASGCAVLLIGFKP
ncbi:MAG: hypothetical protein Kow0079_12700 [Vicingaceae bacterium]